MSWSARVKCSILATEPTGRTSLSTPPWLLSILLHRSSTCSDEESMNFSPESSTMRIRAPADISASSRSRSCWLFVVSSSPASTTSVYGVPLDSRESTEAVSRSISFSYHIQPPAG